MSADMPAGHKPRRSMQIFLRGLAIGLPPVLTLVILLWIVGGIYDYIIFPTSQGVRYSIAQLIDKSRPTAYFTRDVAVLPAIEHCDRNYVVSADLQKQLRRRLAELRRTAAGTDAPPMIAGDIEQSLRQVVEQHLSEVYVPFGDWAVPYGDYAQVAERVRPEGMPGSVTRVYMELVTIRYFPSLFHLSLVAVTLVIVVVYFLGRLVTVRVGAWIVYKFETGILARLPFISRVYSAVKQVTDFVFTEQTVSYRRVVAVQYPSKGLWSLGFVTGDAPLDIAVFEQEPAVAILIPTSPAPMTGFTICVPQSDVVDLDITVEQAFQFIISCGVLLPPKQKGTPELLQQEMARRAHENGGPAPSHRPLDAQVEAKENHT